MKKTYVLTLLFLVTAVAVVTVYAVALQQTQAGVRLIAAAAEALGRSRRAQGS